ncbi:pre-mRNA-splicing factor Cwc22p [Diutina rugosa]
MSSKESQVQRWQHYHKVTSETIELISSTNVRDEIINLIRQVNLLWCSGMVVRAAMERQLADLKATAVLASAMAVLNVHFEEVGEILAARIVLQFRKFYMTNDERIRHPAEFLAHLVNQRVLSEVVLLQVFQILLGDNYTNDSINLAVDIATLCGQHLETQAKTASATIFDRFRQLMTMSHVSTASNRRIKRLFDHRKTKFHKYPPIPKSLDLVPEADRPKPLVIDLGSKIDAQDATSFFAVDPEFDNLEKEYFDEVIPEVLGPTPEADDPTEPGNTNLVINDFSDSERIALQKQVYLVIMSSLSADEAVHKLLRLKLDPQVVADMAVRCCAQEKTYTKFYGQIGDRLCARREFFDIFITLFHKYYQTIDTYESNAVRNIGKFFGHLFAQDYLPIDKSWSPVEISAQGTTVAGRVFLKFVFQQMVEEIGVGEVQKRFDDPAVALDIRGVFPTEDADHLRYSINFFTAIGLGILTETMRNHLTRIEARMEQERGRSLTSGDDRRASNSYSRSRSASYSRSPSPRSRSRSYSRSP